MSRCHGHIWFVNAAMIGSAFLAGCSTLAGVGSGLSAEQRNQVQRDMPRPPVEVGASYESVTVESDLPVPLAVFTRWFAASGAPEVAPYLVGTPGVPGVARTESLTGMWAKPGDRRRIEFTDGNSAVEEIIVDQMPNLFQYEVWNLTNKIGRYTSYAVGEFAFSGNQQNTHVRWTYSFRPRAWPDGWFIRSFVQTDYRHFMESALATMRARVLSDLPET